MEIIVEIIAQLLIWILQFFGELLLQIIFDALAEFIGHSIKEPFRRPEPLHPWLAAIGYFIFGLTAGGLSLYILPELFIKAHWLRIVNLLLTPFVSGLVMAWIGSWRRRHSKEVIRLETFTYGFCFALAMSIVRFTFGN